MQRLRTFQYCHMATYKNYYLKIMFKEKINRIFLLKL